MPKLQNTLVILPYDPNWKTEFERIRDFLMDHIGDLILRLNISAVLRFQACAKPIIDLVAVIESYDVFPQIVSRLEKSVFNTRVIKA